MSLLKEHPLIIGFASPVASPDRQIFSGIKSCLKRFKSIGTTRIGGLPSAVKSLLPVLLLALLAGTPAQAQTAPESFTSTITNGGSAVTIDFVKHPIRSANFSVLVQNSAGGFDPYTAPEPRTYFGSVQGYPGAIAAATLKPSGAVLARIYFENGVEWISTGGGTATTRGSATFTKALPSFTVPVGGADSWVHAAEVGFDSSFAHYSRSGTVDDDICIIEHSVMCANLTYLRDAAILNRVGRIVIRANQSQDPYAGLTGGSALLAEMRNQWNNVLPAGTHDLAAGLYADSVGGGLAWLGVVGGSYGYSVNDSNTNGDFSVVWRHEAGHNWGSDHNEGSSPEGPTLMSGNSLSRFSSPELREVLAHRDLKLGLLDVIGAYAFALPPRANLDLAYAPPGGPVVIDALNNDSDSNDDSISILSFDATSNLGGAVTQVSGGLQLQSVAAHGQSDWFNYRIQDSTGRTATGIVYVQGETPSSKLTGTGIGSTGSYGTGGNTFAKALDGNLTTYYNADSVSGDWVGLDLGAGSNMIVTKVKYCPRDGWVSRINGGLIQASNTPDFSSGVVTLATIGSPPEGMLTTQLILNNTTAYRYVRYLGPDNGSCNIAEIEFWGASPVVLDLPDAPSGLAATPAKRKVTLTWADNSTNETGFKIERSSDGVNFTQIASVAANTTVYTNSGLTSGTTRYYRVRAYNADGDSTYSNTAGATAR